MELKTALSQCTMIDFSDTTDTAHEVSTDDAPEASGWLDHLSVPRIARPIVLAGGFIAGALGLSGCADDSPPPPSVDTELTHVQEFVVLHNGEELFRGDTGCDVDGDRILRGWDDGGMYEGGPLFAIDEDGCKEDGTVYISADDFARAVADDHRLVVTLTDVADYDLSGLGAEPDKGTTGCQADGDQLIWGFEHGASYEGGPFITVDEDGCVEDGTMSTTEVVDRTTPR